MESTLHTDSQQEHSCIFCNILAGNASTERIYEDESTLAFLSIHPVNKGHTIVIPKKHYEDIYEVPASTLLDMLQTVQKVANALRQIADGINLGQNNGAAAGQVVFHVHFHVIPRYADDGLEHWPGKSYIDGESKEIADKIKSLL